MTFRFHPDAEAEFLGAVDWYEERSTGLGADFASEVHAAIRLAELMPLAWSPLDGEVHRVLVNRFPYGVLYAPRQGWIYILAVMHLRRAPGYWRERR